MSLLPLGAVAVHFAVTRSDGALRYESRAANSSRRPVALSEKAINFDGTGAAGGGAGAAKTAGASAKNVIVIATGAAQSRRTGSAPGRRKGSSRVFMALSWTQISSRSSLIDGAPGVQIPASSPGFGTMT
jgi:hypothetical protein